MEWWKWRKAFSYMVLSRFLADFKIHAVKVNCCIKEFTWMYLDGFLHFSRACMTYRDEIEILLGRTWTKLRIYFDVL